MYFCSSLLTTECCSHVGTLMESLECLSSSLGAHEIPISSYHYEILSQLFSFQTAVFFTHLLCSKSFTYIAYEVYRCLKIKLYAKFSDHFSIVTPGSGFKVCFDSFRQYPSSLSYVQKNGHKLQASTVFMVSTFHTLN